MSGNQAVAGIVLTKDGVKLAYSKAGKADPTLVLVHGWSGSRRMFDLNFQELAAECTVYALDLRFHGDSDKPSWGFHIARLAADLKEFIDALELQDVTVVGTSMGCAIIWSYLELFGPQRLAQCVFVDQAPLQNRAEDWQLGSKGCYDAVCVEQLRAALRNDFPAFAAGNVAECASLPLSPDFAELAVAETLRSDPEALWKLMSDHTQLDWRPVLPCISVPCLNCVGRRSAIFPPEGCAAVGELIPNCHTVYFEEANHWLYAEEPAKFNALLSSFARGGISAVQGTTSL